MLAIPNLGETFHQALTPREGQDAGWVCVTGQMGLEQVGKALGNCAVHQVPRDHKEEQRSSEECS